jgi:hypothetical protein
MCTLSALAHRRTDPRLVLVTIHQPTPQVFVQFDQLLLLSATGEVCYFGPPAQTDQYFRSIPTSLTLRCPDGVDPADHYIGK